MSIQQDIFNPIQKDGHTAYWHKFYAPTLKRIKEEQEQKRLEAIENSKPISIKIK